MRRVIFFRSILNDLAKTLQERNQVASILSSILATLPVLTAVIQYYRLQFMELIDGSEIVTLLPASRRLGSFDPLLACAASGIHQGTQPEES